MKLSLQLKLFFITVLFFISYNSSAQSCRSVLWEGLFHQETINGKKLKRKYINLLPQEFRIDSRLSHLLIKKTTLKNKLKSVDLNDLHISFSFYNQDNQKVKEFHLAGWAPWPVDTLYLQLKNFNGYKFLTPHLTPDGRGLAKDSSGNYKKTEKTSDSLILHLQHKKKTLCSHRISLEKVDF